jgi:TubC N-terminal docking domain
MTANQILERMAARGVRITLNDDNLRVDAPAGVLTDEDRQLLKCYKTELLGRLRHPEGDPPLGEYMANVFINGERVRIPMARLIAEGREVVEREVLQPKTAGFDPDLWAATVALGRYDAAHMEWAARNRLQDGTKWKSLGA